MVKFGTKTETLPQAEVAEGEEPKAPETVEVDNIINNTKPAWTKAPSELVDQDYKDFYKELYPYSFEEPLFNIHLNVSSISIYFILL